MPAPSCRRPSRPSSRRSTSGSARSRPTFRQKLLAAAKAGALHVDDAAALAGLSATSRSPPPQEAAKDRKVAGYVLPLQNTTQQPALTSLTSHDTRQKLFEASLNRAEHGDANDTRAIDQRNRAAARQEGGAVRRSRTAPTTTLYDQMAKNRATAVGFLDRLAPAVAAKERQEAADIVAMAKSQGANFQPTRGRLELLCRADPQAALRARSATS